MKKPRHVIRIPQSVETRAYIAGLFDGEGCVTIAVQVGPGSLRRSHRLQISIANCDERLMLWLFETVGGSVKPRKSRSVKHRPGYDWKLFGRNAGELLSVIRDFLIIKKEQADTALAFLAVNRQHGSKAGKPLSDSVVEQRDSFRRKILRLNKKGA